MTTRLQKLFFYNVNYLPNIQKVITSKSAYSSFVNDNIYQITTHLFQSFFLFFKDPVVTRIMRDEKIPIISFVANTGGLLGLCMGFSLVSVFEIMFHCGGAVKKELLRRRKHQTPRNADQSKVVCKNRSLQVVVNRTDRGPSEQSENFIIDEEKSNNDEIRVVSPLTSPVLTSKSNVKFKKNGPNSFLR